MKKNKLNAIFLLHILTMLILLSCSLDISKDNDNNKGKKAKTKISKNGNNLLGANKGSQNDKESIDNLLNAINVLKNPPKILAGNIKNKPNLAALQRPNTANPSINNANASANSPANAGANANTKKQITDPEVKELLQKILDRSEDIKQISEIDSNKGEPNDQFGMKAEIFSKIFFNASATANFDDNEYLNERRMLYTSLNFNEGVILNLGKILSKLSKDSNYRSLVKETLINRGFSIQLAIEEISLKILDVKNKLQYLNKPNLKTLYYDFNKLITFKEKWLKDTDDFINEYNTNLELQTDNPKLNDALRLKNSREQFADIQNTILTLINTTTNILAPIQ
ncbi:complement regulator-acquiring protein (plasmid) [Borrelia sp. CA_690]|uniref:Complement regulator-acquiring protein n=1 Tax=Borrelia maritima TaxID=2761123 RepID=A0A5J6WDQ2_9SPIR|nr:MULTISPECIES: complement regulator-acquiring protein [Borrelia]QFI14998.1 complement regulator-acquiring protein [Borrelia maritima]WKC84005.1 complement regulator-acquiring protein [Borrelia sp. CA_690]